MLDACDVDGEIELAGELTAERTGVAPAGAHRADPRRSTAGFRNCALT
jgi:hypothetical protein